MECPLAVEAKRASAHCVIAQGIVVANVQERPVDYLQAVGTASHQDFVEHIMKVVAWVLGDLYSASKHRHLHACGKVGRAKDDGFYTWACRTNFFHVDEATCGFNLRLDTDVANWQAAGNFYLAQEQVGSNDLRSVLDFWQHDFVEALACTANDFHDVVGSPLCAPVIDANTQHLVAPIVAANCTNDSCARCFFFLRSNCVLEIKEHHVGRNVGAFAHHFFGRAGNGQTGTTWKLA